MILLHTCLQPALLLGRGFGCRGDWELLADSDWDAAGTEGAACSALSEGKRVRAGREGAGCRGVPGAQPGCGALGGQGCRRAGGQRLRGARGGFSDCGNAELGRAGAASSCRRSRAEPGCTTLAVEVEAPAFAAFLTGPVWEGGRKQGCRDGAWLQLPC